MSTKPIEIPERFQPLFKPKRYKVVYGGRGSAKSHSIARALIAIASTSKKRIVCARELQKSVSDSVHKLLCDVIHEHGLASIFHITNTTIVCIPTGSEFKFIGLRHSVAEMKSQEGIDILWVEEAENVSDTSWETAIPTVRKDNSEIWISFNPRFVHDPTYVRFVKNKDPEVMWVEKFNYVDNPFITQPLIMEAERLKRDDPAAYEYIWMGNFDERYTGYIYAKLINKLHEKGQITTCPIEPGVPLITAWDLGWADATSIWFAQIVGFQPRIVHFYENTGQELDHYFNYLTKFAEKHDVEYKSLILPHDAGHKRLGSESYQRQLMDLGVPENRIKVLPVESRIQPNIDKAKMFIQKCIFDKEGTDHGLNALSHYQYEYNDNLSRFKDKPKHDWASHAADAFRYLVRGLDKEIKILNNDLTKTTRSSIYDVLPYNNSKDPYGWLG